MIKSYQICMFCALALMVYLTFFGYMEIFKRKGKNEQDLHIIQRQIRGFAYLSLAPIVGLLIAYLCGAFFSPEINKVVDEIKELTTIDY